MPNRIMPRVNRLFEVAHYVLDNAGLPGDAAIRVRGQEERIGPTSTLSGALLLNLLMMEIVAHMQTIGAELPILRSANIPGGREFNAELSSRYQGRLSRPV